MAGPVGKLGSRLAMFERGADEGKKKVEERKQFKIPTKTGGGVHAAAQKIKDVINIPPAQATQEVWDKFLEGCTQLSYGSSFKDAQLIYIGAFNTEKAQDKLAVRIIERYGKDGDIVLDQDYGMGETVEGPRGIKLTKKIRTYGCKSSQSSEDMEGAKFLKDALKKYGLKDDFRNAPADVELRGKAFVRKIPPREKYAVEKLVTKYLTDLEPTQKIFVIGTPAIVQAVSSIEGVATHIFIPKKHTKWTEQDCIDWFEKDIKTSV